MHPTSTNADANRNKKRRKDALYPPGDLTGLPMPQSRQVLEDVSMFERMGDCQPAHKTGWLDRANEVPNTVDALLVRHAIPQDRGLTKNELNDAFELIQLGLKAIPSNRISSNPSLQTPRRMVAAGVQLSRYQLNAVSDLVSRTNGPLRAALLAFDMGLGKTFILIAMILSNKDALRGTSVIVVPKSLITMWENELEKVIEPSLRVCVYHDSPGHHTNYAREQLKEYQVVVTSYEILKREWREALDARDAFVSKHRHPKNFEAPTRPHCPLFSIVFEYAILEEGHRATNPETAQTQAAYELRALRKVVATGTPIQNDYSCAQSIIRFLDIRPWRDLNLFRKVFMKKKKNDTRAKLLIGEQNAVLALTFRAFTLRLRKDDMFEGKPILECKAPVICEVAHELTPEEQYAQDITKHIWDRKERLRLKKEHVLGGNTDVLGRGQLLPAITAARLHCVHMGANNAYGEFGVADAPIDASLTLDRIMDDIVDRQRDRIKKTHKQARENFIEATATNWQSSRMLVFVKLVEQRLNEDSGKILVFSEFLCLLDLAENALRSLPDGGIQCLRYDGTLDLEQKNETVANFQDVHQERHTNEAQGSNEEHPRVLLVTSRSGGLGLTLTRATTVVILSPHWNPSMEQQCIDRAVRRGQDKTVTVYKFHVHDSIERRVKAVQDTKTKKASSLLDPQTETQEIMSKMESWDRDFFTDKLNDFCTMLGTEPIDNNGGNNDESDDHGSDFGEHDGDFSDE